MDAEQTWPTEEEIQQANGKLIVNQLELVKEQKRMKRVPKGTSAYQAAWILEDYEDGEEVNSDEENEVKEGNAIQDGEQDKGDQMQVSEGDESEQEEYEWIEMDDRAANFDALDEEENAEE